MLVNEIEMLDHLSSWLSDMGLKMTTAADSLVSIASLLISVASAAVAVEATARDDVSLDEKAHEEDYSRR